MTALQPLLTLLAQAERERDQALAAQMRAARSAEAAEQQRQQLLDYRREYEQRWTSQFSQPSQMPLVHCYQSFTNRLGQAVTHQQHTTEQAEQLLARAADAVRAQELKVASVRKLVERRVKEQAVLFERREQKATDEFAARAAWQRDHGQH